MLTEALLLLQQSAYLLASGKILQALQIAQEGLAIDLSNPDLFNIAGVCAMRLGRVEQAEDFWLKALALCPNDSQVNYNLGLLQAGRQRYSESEQYYRQAINFDHGNADAYAQLGMLLALQGRDADAEQSYRQAVAHNPADADTYCNLGVLLSKHKRDDEAEQCYRKALTLNNENAAAYSNLGVLLASRKQYDEAEQCYRQAIAFSPDNAKTHTNLGLLLENLKREDEAERCHQQAIALNPDSSEICSNLANFLTKRKRFEEAEQYYRQAIAINPQSGPAYSNFGVFLASQKRASEAEQCFRQAIAINPHYPLARLNLAFLLLYQGRLAEGWRHHEARYDPALPDPDMSLPHMPFPQWQGESLQGKSLLIWPEQGLGDAIQFCRYVPLLKQQGTSRITLVCRPPLKSLMSTLFGVDRVLALEEIAEPLPEHDYWAFPMSLPLHCETDLSNIPAYIPYLSSTNENQTKWSLRLPENGLRVGLVWKGNVHHANDANRSLPGLSTLAPLWSVPNVQFISLQKGAGEDEANHPSDHQPIVHLGSDFTDFSDAAAVIQQLDLIISVDTAIAHLAGALGKPCWVLLPSENTDWRWMDSRTDSPWYPNVMRLFRQSHGADWTQVIACIKQALIEKASGLN
ncbi:MAG: tetratricopeptide repeat protein [Burkholderiaceae bacterium]